MVQIKRQASSEDLTKTFQEFESNVDKIKDALMLFTRTVQKKTADISVLDAQIKELSKKSATFQSSLQVKEEEFRIASEKKAQQALSDAIKKGEKQADSIVSLAKIELADLNSKKLQLEKAVNDLSESYSKKSSKFNEEIKESEGHAVLLRDEVKKLTLARDELHRQIASIKEKVAYLT